MNIQTLLLFLAFGAAIGIGFTIFYQRRFDAGVKHEARADNRGVLLSAQRHDGALVFSRRASRSGRWSHLDRDFGEPTNRPLVILSHRVGAALITSACDSRKRRR
jgi:hypothetical protein